MFLTWSDRVNVTTGTSLIKLAEFNFSIAVSSMSILVGVIILLPGLVVVPIITLWMLVDDSRSTRGDQKIELMVDLMPARLATKEKGTLMHVVKNE